MQSLIKKEYSKHLKTAKATHEIIGKDIETAAKLCIDGLKKGGKLIFPKKCLSGTQKLILIEKIDKTEYKHKTLFDVRFVPLL